MSHCYKTFYTVIYYHSLVIPFILYYKPILLQQLPSINSNLQQHCLIQYYKCSGIRCHHNLPKYLTPDTAIRYNSIVYNIGPMMSRWDTIPLSIFQKLPKERGSIVLCAFAFKQPVSISTVVTCALSVTEPYRCIIFNLANLSLQALLGL
jgi:hypothetical protein